MRSQQRAQRCSRCKSGPERRSWTVHFTEDVAQWWRGALSSWRPSQCSQNTIIRQSPRIVDTLRVNYVLLVNVPENDRNHSVSTQHGPHCGSLYDVSERLGQHNTEAETWVSVFQTSHTWSASVQHQSMGSDMSFETLTNIPFLQLRNAAPRVLPWSVVSSSLQSRYLHVLTQLSHVSISLLMRSALLVQLRPPSRLSGESEALPQQTHETVFIAWSWDEIRMPVSRLSRLDDIDKQRPGLR